MSTNKHIDKICCVILAFTLTFSVFAMGLGAFNKLGQVQTGYELKLFDDTKVHTINIVMGDWDSFIENCENEEYTSCSIIVDNESFKNVAIRAKGNTSLSSVSKYGNDRYSFKIEFDHYESNTYYGLDKLSLNNVIQDNTYMKDYLVYTLMREHGVSAPLCSFVNIKINGESFGLYLAVEGVEDSFLSRNYGSDFGELYKPDSTGMGGGRGNGKEFTEEKIDESVQVEGSISTNKSEQESSSETVTESDNKQFRKRFQNGEMPQLPEGEAPQLPFNKNGGNQKLNNVGGGRGNGSSDVLLQYTDDNFSSYQNIFDNAKTDITDADKTRLIKSLKGLSEGTNIESCVDIESVIRYFVVHNFVCNFDSYTGQMIHNYYLYENDGVMSMIPWDYNLAFGGFMSGSDATTLINFPIDSPVLGGDMTNRPMIAWIFNNDEYKELYHQYMNEFIEGVFDSGYFEEKFISVSKMITPYVREDESSFCTYEEFAKGISALKSFCELRAESVKGQLDGTIPSSSEAQRSDNSSLIDAKELNINDMGSMGMGGGGFKDFGKTSEQKNTDDKIEETTGSQINIAVNKSTNAFIQLSSNSLAFFDLVNSFNTEEITGFSPEMWQGGMGERPQIPNGEMPQMPNGEMPQMPNGEMPQMPNGEMPQMPNGEMPQMPDGEIPNNEVPETTEESSTVASEESIIQSDESITSSRDENSFNKDRFPAENQQETTVSGEVAISTLLSMVVLAGGLIFAKSFRRYKV